MSRGSDIGERQTKEDPHPTTYNVLQFHPGTWTHH